MTGMTTEQVETITIRAIVLPSVQRYDKLIHLRSLDTPMQGYASTEKALLGYSQTTTLHWASLLKASIDFTIEAEPHNPREPARDAKGYMSPHILPAREGPGHSPTHRETGVQRQGNERAQGPHGIPHHVPGPNDPFSPLTGTH